MHVSFSASRFAKMELFAWLLHLQSHVIGLTLRKEKLYTTKSTGLFIAWSISMVYFLYPIDFSNNKWFITVKSMPVSNLMMVKTSLLFGLISKFGMYTGLGKILLSKIITLSIGSW